LIKTFARLRDQYSSLRAESVLALRTQLPRNRYEKPERRFAFYKQVLERVRALPGVITAAYTTSVPLDWKGGSNSITIEGRPVERGVDYDANHRQISADYFTTIGIALEQGRFFDEGDNEQSMPVAIINKTMAITFWPHQNPIGRRIRPGGSKDWCTIIGIVDDVKNAGLDRPAGTELYLPYRQPAGAGNSDMYVVMRTPAGDPRSLAGVVREQLNEIDPSLPLADVRLMEDVLTRAQARPRFLTLLLSLFSAVALAIATVGIYGVVSYSVARRTKEFGLRMVLGAQGGDVLGLVMKQGAGMVTIGIVAGLATAFALTRLMASLLFGVTATDLPTFAGVTVVLFGVALAACYVPALRATRVDPIQTLRYE